ncbi:hypothetical protein MIND_00933100 [Mycena indigotica]|uniref:Uncharacterized protein n=1 Tax=Mycena indigotica TaxID=2126181 RepID=A0A8H6SDL4_9AGAR|nr:uncharacterized protein MIND_00933100 [Mycena indigotica]KAF7297008.1 hypothetical protein MIND_00933100 [Mycena indigotica]
MASASASAAASTNTNTDTTECTAQTSLGCGMPSPGTLYLLIFVGTLVILLLIAAVMIARGVYRRRRLRALGLLPRPPWPVRVGVRPPANADAARPRPMMHDVYIEPEDGKVRGVCSWGGIVPLSAALLLPAPADAGPLTEKSDFPQPPAQRRTTILRPAAADNSMTPDSEPPSPMSPTTRVACVIAMPVPNPEPRAGVLKMRGEDEDGEEEDAPIPVLELGTADVEVCGAQDAYGLCFPIADANLDAAPP